MRRVLRASARSAWRAIIAVIGVSVILIGVLLFFTPGPAILVIPLGLSILATEFLWAGRLLSTVKEGARTIMPARRSPGA
jgi:tellurite resistance protein TerC